MSYSTFMFYRRLLMSLLGIMTSLMMVIMSNEDGTRVCVHSLSGEEHDRLCICFAVFICFMVRPIVELLIVSCASWYAWYIFNGSFCGLWISLIA